MLFGQMSVLHNLWYVLFIQKKNLPLSLMRGVHSYIALLQSIDFSFVGIFFTSDNFHNAEHGNGQSDNMFR